MAKELGITTMALNNYEAGRRFPSRYLCKKMDDGLIELIDRRALAALAERRSGKA